jgi:hypothetical protein
MPAVEICFHCSKKIDILKEEFVVLTDKEPSKGIVRVIAHLACAQKANDR